MSTYHFVNNNALISIFVKLLRNAQRTKRGERIKIHIFGFESSNTVQS